MTPDGKKKRGRPPIELDEAQVRKLAERGWSGAEIAAFFGVHPDTIAAHFSVLIYEARAAGMGKIRDMVWTAAEKGDTRALLHLARHRLNEHDRVALSLSDASDAQLCEEVKARIPRMQAEQALKAKLAENYQAPDGQDIKLQQLQAVREVARSSDDDDEKGK